VSAGTRFDASDWEGDRRAVPGERGVAAVVVGLGAGVADRLAGRRADLAVVDEDVLARVSGSGDDV
jgi:hypothetical protein